MNKIETSIAYQFSNCYMRNMVFYRFSYFYKNLKEGPVKMKNFLVDRWYELVDGLRDNNNIIVSDIEKVVLPSEFDITVNKTRDNSIVYFIKMPNSNIYKAESICVAVALTKDKPRYFTLELGRNVNGDKNYFMGEFVLIDDNFKHVNYGILVDNSISNFAYQVIYLLNNS